MSPASAQASPLVSLKASNSLKKAVSGDGEEKCVDVGGL